MIPEMNSFVITANRYFEICDEIVKSTKSFNPTNLKALYYLVPFSY